MNRALHHVIVTRDPKAWITLRRSIDEFDLAQFTDSLTIETSLQRPFNVQVHKTLGADAADIFCE